MNPKININKLYSFGKVATQAAITVLLVVGGIRTYNKFARPDTPARAQKRSLMGVDTVKVVRVVSDKEKSVLYCATQNGNYVEVKDYKLPDGIAQPRQDDVIVLSYDNNNMFLFDEFKVLQNITVKKQAEMFAKQR